MKRSLSHLEDFNLVLAFCAFSLHLLMPYIWLMQLKEEEQSWKHANQHLSQTTLPK